ncbi:MAG: hypothetical protein ACI4RV_02745 [Eubacteriales bacterium]
MNKKKYQSPSLELHAQDTVDVIMGSSDGDIIVDVLDPLYKDIAMTYLAENDMEHFSAYYR